MSKFHKIGVSTRIVSSSENSEKRDAISHDWPPFLDKFDAIPILIPNTLSNVKLFLTENSLDAIILSGGDNIGEYPERDKTEQSILEYGIEKNIPIFGVCRGMQLINNFFEGSIIQNTNKKHVATTHSITIVHKRFSLLLNSESIMVNSYHDNTITNNILGHSLTPFAVSEIDNTIEGFFHDELPILGVMWHPERQDNHNDELIFKKFFSEKSFWK